MQMSFSFEGGIFLLSSVSKINIWKLLPKRDATGHDYSVITIIAPTCCEQGYTLHSCSKCDDYYTTDFVAAKGHSESEWIIDIEATCTYTGCRHKICTKCKDILEIEVIPATGHNYGEIYTMEPTCTEAGYTYQICSVCGHKEIVAAIEAKGHTEDHSAIENQVEATCTTDGSYETVIYCKDCGEELSREKTVVPATGHNESEWIVVLEANCTHSGMKQKVCTDCGRVLERVRIPQLEHTYGDVQIVEATCTKEGYTYCQCSECGVRKTLSTIEYTGVR